MMHALRRAGFAVALCLMLVAVAGCKTAPTANVSGEQAVFRINVDTWIGYAPLYLAEEKGYFEDVDVQIQLIPDVAQRKLAIARGDNEAIAETVDMLVLDQSEGVPTRAVMTLDLSLGADGIVATEDIKTLQDLVGQEVLVQKNYASEALLNYLLEENGIALDSVKTLDTEAGAAGAAFAAGQTKAAVTFEPWLSKAAEVQGGHVLISSKEAPGVIVDVLSVRADFLRDHPEVVKTVARGWYRALDEWKANPAESNVIMAKAYGITPEEFAANVEGLHWPSLAESTDYFAGAGSPNIHDIMDTFVRIFLKTGQVRTAPDLSQAVDASILESLGDAR